MNWSSLIWYAFNIAIDDSHLPFAVIDANLFWCHRNGDTEDMRNHDFPYRYRRKENRFIFIFDVVGAYKFTFSVYFTDGFLSLLFIDWNDDSLVGLQIESIHSHLCNALIPQHIFFSYLKKKFRIQFSLINIQTQQIFHT